MTRTNNRALANTPNNSVSVLDFGAVGDGVTDDTAAIQAAINQTGNKASVYFPSGDYLITSTLTSQRQYFDLNGDGASSRIVCNTDIGTMLKVGDISTGSNLPANSIKNILFQADELSGNCVHLENLSRLHFENISVLLNKGVGVRITGCDTIYMISSDLNCGRTDDGTGADVLVEHLYNGDTKVKDSASIYIDSSQLRANTTDANLRASLIVKGVDGLYCTNTHFGIAQRCVHIKPDVESSIIGGINITNCYIDGNVGVVARGIVIESTFPAGNLGNIIISDNFIPAFLEAAILIDAASAKNINIDSNLFSGNRVSGIDITKSSSSINITGNKFDFGNLSALGRGSDIALGGAARFININDNIFNSPNCTNGNIRVTAGVSDSAVANNICPQGTDYNFATQTGVAFRDNDGIATSVQGVTVSQAGATTTFSHGLVGTPSYVNLTLRGAAIYPYVTGVSSTDITFEKVNVSDGSANVGAGFNVYYEASILP